MFKEVKIGDVTVPMIANGATPYRYRLLFKKDLITEFQNAESDPAKVTACIPELAFIMAKAAESKEGKADMNLLNEETYLSWLEQFGPLDLPLAADDILSLYTGNQITTATPKKKETKAE